MLQKLEADKKKIPKIERDDMIALACTAMESLSFDKEKAFKSLFLTNSLDGSDDFMVSDKLYSLIGKQIKDIRQKLMNDPCPKNLQELLKTITPPKGIKRKNNIEGSELYYCEGPEISISEQDKEFEEFDTDGKILLLAKPFKRSFLGLKYFMKTFKVGHCIFSQFCLLIFLYLCNFFS